jgi:hypothetical protein
MIKVLEQAIEKVRGLSEDQQAYAAETLEEIATHTAGAHRLGEDERRLILEGIAAADGGDFASEADVQAVLGRYRE